MNRRGFLTSILALGAAPAIVRAESLMKLWVPDYITAGIYISVPLDAWRPLYPPNFGRVTNIVAWNRALTNEELMRITR